MFSQNYFRFRLWVKHLGYLIVNQFECLVQRKRKSWAGLAAIALPDCPSFTRSPPTVTFTSGLEDNKSYSSVRLTSGMEAN